MILEVSVARILAFTPLPKPSDSTMQVASSVLRTLNLSPQSSSPYLFRLNP
jgi:hypothetical protein